MLELRAEVEELYADYAHCLDDDELERWPEFFTDDCIYTVVPRENYDRNLPLALIRCESKGMLQDRVEALRRTSVYAPRTLRHLVGSLRLRALDDGALRVQANYAVLQTPLDEATSVFSAGRYIDTLVRQAGAWRFHEKLCVCDTVLVPGSLIYPI